MKTRENIDILLNLALYKTVCSVFKFDTDTDIFIYKF